MTQTLPAQHLPQTGFPSPGPAGLPTTTPSGPTGVLAPASGVKCACVYLTDALCLAAVAALVWLLLPSPIMIGIVVLQMAVVFSLLRARTGRTPGALLAHTAAVADGTSRAPGLKRQLIRSVLMTLLHLTVVGPLLSILLGRDGRDWVDRVCGSSPPTPTTGRSGRRPRAPSRHPEISPPHRPSRPRRATPSRTSPSPTRPPRSRRAHPPRTPWHHRTRHRGPGREPPGRRNPPYHQHSPHRGPGNSRVLPNQLLTCPPARATTPLQHRRHPGGSRPPRSPPPRHNPGASRCPRCQPDTPVTTRRRRRGSRAGPVLPSRLSGAAARCLRKPHVWHPPGREPNPRNPTQVRLRRRSVAVAPPTREAHTPPRPRSPAEGMPSTATPWMRATPTKVSRHRQPPVSPLPLPDPGTSRPRPRTVIPRVHAAPPPRPPTSPSATPPRAPSTPPPRQQVPSRPSPWHGW